MTDISNDLASDDVADEVRLATMESLASKLGVEFDLTDWSGDCFDALWKPVTAFPWRKLRVLYRTEFAVELAMWVEGRLVGMAFICMHWAEDAILIQAVEGDRAADCPLRGKRALIAIEAAQFYAQALGKKYLILQPVDGISEYYVKEHGFVDDREKTHSNYLWRKVQ